MKHINSSFRPFIALVLIICSSSLPSCAKKVNDIPVLSGPWVVSILTPDIGQLQVVMYFDAGDATEAGNRTFFAYTEKGADKKILGSWKAIAGRMVGSNFKNGSLIRIDDGILYKKDSLSGILVTPFGKYRLGAVIKNGHMDGRLIKKGQTLGYVQAVKGMPHLPLHNYTALLDTAFAVTRNKLYDPSLLHTSEWKKFRDKMTDIAAIANDDASFVMAFFYYGHSLLPFSHYAFLHSGKEIDENDTTPEVHVYIEEKSPRTIYMRITSFSGDSGEIDRAFLRVAQKKYDTLIVDLRNNTGGTIEAGMTFMRHLVSDTAYGGIFLTQKYFASHTAPPGISDYKNFTHFSAANFNLIIQGISEYPGICLVSYPKKPVYKGKVFVLVNGKTASTCEPIVYALKQLHIATLAGTRTAGAMLNGEQYDLGSGYKIIIPTATYYTSDGYKIDKNGVEPDISTADKDALEILLGRK